MSLFQCECCGCRENTALSWQGFRMFRDDIDWAYAPEREGLRLCSACGPTHFKSGEPTDCGKWHDQFERVFLPLGSKRTGITGCVTAASYAATTRRSHWRAASAAASAHP